MRLGMPGQLIVVESAPIAMVKAGQCGGTSDDYPVQNVIVMDGTQTHVTSIIVCAAQGLVPGQRLTLNSARVGTDAPPTGSGRYVRLTATLL
jgi:hypothetical protein